MAQNDLDMIEVKSAYVHSKYPPRPTFSCDLPYDEPFAICDTIFRMFTGSKMTVTCSKSILPMCILHIYLKSNVCPIILYDDPFRVMVQFWKKKLALNEPK